MFVIVPPAFVTVAALRLRVPVLVFVIPDELVNELVVPLIVSVPLLVTAVPLKVEPWLALVIVKLSPALMLHAVYALLVMLNESNETLGMLSCGAFSEPLGAPKVTSAPAKVVDMGAAQEPPLHCQLLVVLQLSLEFPATQVMLDALACRFHISNIIAPKRNALFDRRFFVIIFSLFR
jgi:hypothetical protein